MSIRSTASGGPATRWRRTRSTSELRWRQLERTAARFSPRHLSLEKDEAVTRVVKLHEIGRNLRNPARSEITKHIWRVAVLLRQDQGNHGVPQLNPMDIVLRGSRFPVQRMCRDVIDVAGLVVTLLK